MSWMSATALARSIIFTNAGQAMSKGEFEIIEKYFARLTETRAEALGLKDDAAILDIPPGHQLVVSTDTANAGTHFLVEASPADIAHKVLRQNLSDLAAMGAQPYCYQLAMVFPEKFFSSSSRAQSRDLKNKDSSAPLRFSRNDDGDKWLKNFTDALLADQQEFGIFCSGGDTTSINGALSITITAMGIVPAGGAVKRAGAKPGDVILLTGPVGDAYIGLKALRGELDNCFNANVVRAYLKPTPRLDLSAPIQAYAHAAIDISDGLIADLGHICAASGCGAQVQMSAGLFSKSGYKLIEEGRVSAQELLSGGDDYELLLACTPQDAAHFPGAIVIGEFTQGQGVSIMDESGETLPIKHTGWSHF
ncbi:MAG: thiamine-monophosphate kinase [Alphaproteobacteria bacterium]|nr:thiamine-monophosphate kinase [Alphaproteobacteria bacterium]